MALAFFQEVVVDNMNPDAWRGTSSADRLRGAGDAGGAVPGGTTLKIDRRCPHCGAPRDRTSFVIMGLLAVATIAAASALIFFLGYSCI